MSTLMSYLTGLGLAGGVGAKAAIPLLLLGVVHHSGYFRLSPQWDWIAAPPVMVILGLLAVAEIVVDSHADLGEYADLVHYLPKAIAGFIAFAAATGTLDSSVAQLAASGILGAATASGAHMLRTTARRPLRDHVEHAHPQLGLAASLGEAAASAATAGAALVAPLVGLVLLVAVGFAAAAVAYGADSRRVACAHPDCGRPVRPGALVCPHCKRDQPAGALSA